jgi:chromosome segregation ATPase
MSDATADRLQEIQGELASILEARLGELTHALRSTEGTTRRIIGAEIEIERHRSGRDALEAELRGLSAEVEAARASAEQVRANHAQLFDERDVLRAEVERLEREVREADAEAERTRQRVAALTDEAEMLRNENISLKTKMKTLEENITRLRRLKEELASSISGLTSQMTTEAAVIGATGALGSGLPPARAGLPGAE